MPVFLTSGSFPLQQLNGLLQALRQLAIARCQITSDILSEALEQGRVGALGNLQRSPTYPVMEC
jgi:hypothetical protein